MIPENLEVWDNFDYGMALENELGVLDHQFISHRGYSISSKYVARDGKVLGVDLARHFSSRMLEKITAYC